MRSLRFKFTIIILAVSLCSVALVALFARWVTIREFDRFVTDGLRNDVARIMTDYYEKNHSWEGILQALPPPPGALGKATAGAPAPAPSEDNPAQFALLDKNGCVVVPAGELKLGDCQPALVNLQQKEIVVDGEVAGVLVSALGAPGLTTIETAYLARTNRSILYSTLGAALLALLFGISIARSMIAPLQKLTMAVQAVANGDLKQEVAVTTTDELGDLAQAFNQMSTDLARANQARRQMTADIAHELRNPLMVMIGYIEAMRDEVLKPTPERLNAIYDEAQHLQRLVADLRTLSLADTGELTMQYETIRPQEVLVRVHQAYLSLAQQKQITLTLEVSEDLPETECDPERIVQVLNNLLNNALRHTDDGGKIILSAKIDEPTLLLRVTDTGEGIPPESLPFIFDRLYRVDPARQSSGSESGLGLTIVKSIVTAHQGDIRVESRVGEGTEFTVQLPLRQTNG